MVDPVIPRTTAEIRGLDRRAIQELGIPGLILMENAGSGAAASALTRHTGRPAAHIWCGAGNNGGDGFVIGRHLHNAGWRVWLWCAFELEAASRSGDAGVNLGIAERMGLPVADLHTGALEAFSEKVQTEDLTVDALLGTGVRGAPRPPYDEVIAAINDAGATVMAVDIPSGLNGDDGTVAGACVRADWTVTFAAPKAGFSQGEGPRHTGPVERVPISIPRDFYSELAGQPGGRT